MYRIELTEPGYAVLTINSTDADRGENARVRYSLASSPTDTFYINEDTGVIYTNQTLTFNPRQPVLQLVVKAQDKGQPSLSSVVAVRIQIADVNNNAPKFSQDVYTYVIFILPMLLIFGVNLYLIVCNAGLISMRTQLEEQSYYTYLLWTVMRRVIIATLTTR